MIARTLSLSADWKEKLDLQNRDAPDIFEIADDVRNTPHADAIRTGLSKLGLSAVFCVNGVPTIAIRHCKTYDPSEIQQIHAALWNQGLASVFVVISEDIVRTFSLAKTPFADDSPNFEDRCLIETLDATTSALQLQSLITGAETGRLWREKKEYFRPNERIDAVLLNNLEQAHALLTKSSLKPDEAQAILIQTMFMAYLEDRGVIGPEYFAKATKGKFGQLSRLLGEGDSDVLASLFKQLQTDFNGDLFFAPCSFEKSETKTLISPNHMRILQRFRLGQEEMDGEGGQLRFWGYDFRYIPVELISAVYDRFLGHDRAQRKNAGAFYTPIFLVDCVVSSTWQILSERQKEKATYLDPACGSGIFLVRCFQRMCEHWRETRNQTTIRWDSLQKMLARVHGRDINAGAVRVAVFSLYLALLEQVSPPDLRKLIDDKGRLLPALWGKTLIERDFFSENHEEKHDVIIGNPPWTSRKGMNRTAIAWSSENGYPIPSGEEAWAFTWKALWHLQDAGVTAFLLPAMGFLHNHASASIAARERLFCEARVQKIINFSDLRFQLFDGAIRPAALLMFNKIISDAVPYEFEYWAPKADLNLSIKRFITLSRTDKSTLRSTDVFKNSLLFKHRLWMRAPEAKLFSYLSSFPKLGVIIVQSRKQQNKSEGSSEQLVIGQGFQPYNDGRSTTKVLESDFVGNYPYLSIRQYTPLAINFASLKRWPSRNVRRRGFEAGFAGSRILIPRGVQTSRWRLRAAYTEQPLTFQHIIQAISVPKGKEDQAKLITAILNSRLALWFAFHGTASFGSDRPEVQQAELTRLPFPSPEDISDPKRSKNARMGLISIIDDSIKNSNSIMVSDDAEEEKLRRIDRLTYDYFGLTEDEITLIEDAADYILPAVQPHAGSYPELWQETRFSDRQAYSKTLQRRLSAWLADDYLVSIRLVARNLDFSILELSLSPDRQKQHYTENNPEPFTEALSRLSKEIGQPINENFMLVPDIRLFVGSCLYLIKPLQRRFWLRSTALADADNLALDLETLTQSKVRRGRAS